MKLNAGNLKKGNFINYKGEIYQVVKSEFYSPGKGSALMRTKLKGISSGKTIDYTFKSNEIIETLDVEVRETQYLYADKDNLYFMDTKNFTQYQLSKKIAGDVYLFLKEGMSCYIYIYNNEVLNLRSPQSVRLKVIEAPEAIKGDRVGGAKKAVILETGVKIMAPLFIKKGDVVVVNPETGEYVERSN